MGKWLVRGGSILALVGFFLPSVLVSCSVPGIGGFLNSNTSYSLADLANEFFIRQEILFLIPVLLLVSLIFSFLPLSGDTSRPSWNASLLGQAIGFLASLGTLVISLLDLSRQVSQAGNLPFSIDLSQAIKIQPEVGLFILVAGYLAMLAGLIYQIAALVRHRPPGAAYPAPVAPYGMAPPQDYVPRPVLYSLELIQPGLPPATLVLQGPQYLLGRGEGCNILLPDLSVSRQHAFLYFFEGGWQIEDRGSTAGTLVNGRAVHSARLNPGDQIQLGRVTLILRGL